MGKNEMIQLLKDKIPNDHLLKMHVHEIEKIPPYQKVSSFIVTFIEALELVDKSIPEYSKRIVEWIGTLNNKEQSEQNYAVLSEVLVLSKAAQVADSIQGVPFIQSEPRSSKNSKNPEFRSKLSGKYYAGEVKTPSLKKFKEKRQSGFQVTTHLPDREVISIDNIINPKLLTVKDFLVNTEEKYSEYILEEQFKEDFRFLFIVWDDFINEAISALTSPFCGLFTPNSFYKESNFELIDGVFIIRHLHQFHSGINDYALLDGLENAFQWSGDKRYTLMSAFVQNPYGRKVPDVFLNKFNVVPPDEMTFGAEYQPTDWIDWRTGIGISGLESIPVEHHNEIFKIINNQDIFHMEPRINYQSAHYSVINLDRILEGACNGDGRVLVEKFIESFKEVYEIALRVQPVVEKNYKLQLLEREAHRNDISEKLSKVTQNKK
ncbi:hypothetical protein FHG65_00175 [Bacillus cereus]|uniref:Uncharacterized protein n=1 Tax=Bacillus cereus TaxID=1396 RepID=A0ABD7RMD5_BACCE|nr:hypothetical protein [Bacillus cereus]TNC02660.1 hypothetical protein FHG65_00175 [Bacillus cereus]